MSRLAHHQGVPNPSEESTYVTELRRSSRPRGVVGGRASGVEARLGQHVGGGFEARLVRCADVTLPAALSGCGSDPLDVGLLQIEFGTLRIIINGAARDATYTVLLRAPGGGPVAALGTMTTNDGGHG